MDRKTLIGELNKYKFFQTIDLGNGIMTPGLPISGSQRQVLGFINGMDLKGKRVIDLGCANGLFALATEKKGAGEVMAVDHTKQNIEGLQNVILPYLGSTVKAKQMNVLNLESKTFGKFDLVIFAGVLYHLKYPFLALRVVRDLVKEKGTVILETAIVDRFNRNSLLYCPNPTDTPFKSRLANTCSLFNEKALCENLEYFGLGIVEKAHVTKPLRRFVKKLGALIIPSYYPTSNIVLRCERNSSIENPQLKDFYESTTD